MFTVYDRNTFKESKIAKEVHVYDIIYNKSGYPLFLVKQNEQWVKRSAKHFLTKDEVYGRHID